MTEELAAVEEGIRGATVPGSTTLLLRLVPVMNAFHFRMTTAATGFPLMQGAAALAVAVAVAVEQGELAGLGPNQLGRRILADQAHLQRHCQGLYIHPPCPNAAGEAQKEPIKAVTSVL